MKLLVVLASFVTVDLHIIPVVYLLLDVEVYLCSNLWFVIHLVVLNLDSLGCTEVVFT